MIPPSPFTRLARTHAGSAAGDGAVAVALAGSLFFSADVHQAKWRVVLYLALTLAPFSVVAPLMGPAIDRARGGARWIMIGTCLARAFVALLMVGHIDTFLLFPEAFAMLVMGKGYQVAKSAYLPTTVHSDAELVSANSKLALLSALSASVGAAPAAAAAKLGGAKWAIAVAMVWFAVATGFAILVPRPAATKVGAPTAQERAELHSAGVRLASSAMGMLRAIVGFLSLWIAFELRARQASPFEFGLVLGPIGIGAISGSALAPRARKVLAEEHMLLGALGLTAAAGLFSAFIGGLMGAALVAGVVALVSASAKQAFDSLVQRDAPHADHGRAFAQYEARFQLVWVIGALTGVLLPVPLRIGFGGVGFAAIVAAGLFFAGRRALASGGRPPRLFDLLLRLAAEPQSRRPASAGGPSPGDAQAQQGPSPDAGSAAALGGAGASLGIAAGAGPAPSAPQAVGLSPGGGPSQGPQAVGFSPGGGPSLAPPGPRPAPAPGALPAIPAWSGPAEPSGSMGGLPEPSETSGSPWPVGPLPSASSAPVTQAAPWAVPTSRLPIFDVADYEDDVDLPDHSG